MTTVNIKLETWPVSRLQPYEHNAKAHPEDQVDAIVSSIQRFGFNDPIGVSPEGEILEGHGRLLAAQKLGLSEVPVFVVSGLDERQRGLYRIAHNKISLSTGFHLETLVSELRTLLDDDGITPASMGFDDGDIARLFGGLQEPPVTEDGTDTKQPEYVLIWDGPEHKDRFEAFIKDEKEPDEVPGATLVRCLSRVLYAELTKGERHEQVTT